jgi:hypothetical protein
MAYRVRSGTLTVIAVSVTEALKMRERLLGDGSDVIITDMSGMPLLETLLADIAREETDRPELLDGVARGPAEQRR